MAMPPGSVVEGALLDDRRAAHHLDGLAPRIDRAQREPIGLRMGHRLQDPAHNDALEGGSRPVHGLDGRTEGPESLGK